MRVLMLSWEYPPLVVGGLGRHVEALARQLVVAGHHVQVVTRGEKAEATDELVDGVHVRRSASDPLAIDFTTESLLAWSQAAEHSLLRAALPLLADNSYDVLHAHDWLVAQSAVTLGQLAGTPLVATMHATEAGRHQGWLPRPLNLAIHSVERWLARSAQRLITCSRPMRAEVARLFELPLDGIDVVPNGVDLERWHSEPRHSALLRATHAPDGPLLAFAGRLVHEKGLHTLLDAMRPLRARHPGLRLAIAGTGPVQDELRARCRRLRIARSVDWLGFVPEEDVAVLLAAADAVVVPSLYEPFGIVALEAAAAGTALIVAETGGLADLATDGVAAAAFTAGDVDGLTRAVSGVLGDERSRQSAVARASRIVSADYTWAAVAAHTADVYRSV